MDVVAERYERNDGNVARENSKGEGEEEHAVKEEKEAKEDKGVKKEEAEEDDEWRKEGRMNYREEIGKGSER